ncbi:nitrate reductase subunit alpha [Salmonella enterica]|nr:nitrate reductase subunit alpha [Salmonella enterica]
MSKLLDRFRYFKQKGDTFADGHGQVMHTNRDWEDSYRQRWQFDKIVRSTHGVNCTGSCSWKIYVKNGLVTWETQQTDYPRTRPDLPNHEPRGCPRGASYSWYLYSANRLKYPLVRKRLIELWREALSRHSDPVLAWESIMNDPQKCQSYKQVRGHGGFIRSNWKELNQLIAAANVWTIKTYGPDRVAGFSPIPAMSMVSYAAGTRYLSLLGGTCLSFYDWYCDLPPASPMTWGEQTDVPESADWYNSAYIIAWRSNLLGSSGKGHEYMLKYLLGTDSGIQGEALGSSEGIKPEEVEWQSAAIEGKLDLLVTLDFRMSSTCLFSDIVLPTATWYEKDDMNTSDMHPFIHPLSAAVDPAWESKSDWEIYKGIASVFSEVCVGHLGQETDVVLHPLQHDSPAELAQPFDILDWRKGECELIPGKTAPNIVVVERDYPATYERFTSLGPLLDKLGNGGKGIAWNTQDEVDFLGKLNYTKHDGPAKGRPRIDTALDASEVILALAPETNGQVAVKAWQALGEMTGREHTHLAINKEDEKIRFRDIQAQPRKIISSPTWSGLESEHVSYNAGYTNVHELIPWRTLSGRQQLYQDHAWMRAFGESLVAYRPPIDTRSVSEMREIPPNGFPEKALNFLTPHQKWGIHSTYSENLLMLTLSRGGPIVWISEADARELGIEDNDWIEAFNANGALTARAVVSQRVPPGMTMMYHAQERIMNIPGSEVTGMRGGIHNSVTRVCPKPTHMIGGYAQLAYGFNYYGTVGSNRDEFIMIRKMKNINWLDDEGRDQVQEAKK